MCVKSEITKIDIRATDIDDLIRQIESHREDKKVKEAEHFACVWFHSPSMAFLEQDTE